MRRKMSMLDVLSWNIRQIPEHCSYCDKKPVAILWATWLFGRAERKLCDEHIQKWINGDLFI